MEYQRNKHLWMSNKLSSMKNQTKPFNMKLNQIVGSKRKLTLPRMNFRIFHQQFLRLIALKNS